MSAAAAMTSDPIIRVVNMDCGYDGSPPILENVNFEVARGQVFGILGGSGCGKSTLLKHMIGLIPPIAGQAWIDGADIVAADGPDLLAIRRKFGVMYQSGALPGYSAGDCGGADDALADVVRGAGGVDRRGDHDDIVLHPDRHVPEGGG